VGILFFFVLGLSYKSDALEGVLGNFSMPLVSEEGVSLGVVHGESAKILNENNVEIIKVDATISIPGFLNVWKMKTSQCIFKKKEQRILTDQAATFETLGLTIHGVGLKWVLGANSMTFFKNATLNLDKKLFRTKES
jgi:hypothetical protein